MVQLLYIKVVDTGGCIVPGVRLQPFVGIAWLRAVTLGVTWCCYDPFTKNENRSGDSLIDDEIKGSRILNITRMQHYNKLLLLIYKV